MKVTSRFERIKLAMSEIFFAVMCRERKTKKRRLMNGTGGRSLVHVVWSVRARWGRGLPPSPGFR